MPRAYNQKRLLKAENKRKEQIRIGNRKTVTTVGEESSWKIFIALVFIFGVTALAIFLVKVEIFHHPPVANNKMVRVDRRDLHHSLQRHDVVDYQRICFDHLC